MQANKNLSEAKSVYEIVCLLAGPFAEKVEVKAKS